jgi:SAM-dependent methyltransferase
MIPRVHSAHNWWRDINTRMIRGTLDFLAKRDLVTANAVGLDIGAGDGALSRELESRFACRVHRLDILQHNEHRRPCLLASAEALPFRDQSVDFACLRSVLHHLTHARAALEETRRVLRPNGWVLFVEPRVPCWLQSPWTAINALRGQEESAVTFRSFADTRAIVEGSGLRMVYRRETSLRYPDLALWTWGVSDQVRLEIAQRILELPDRARRYLSVQHSGEAGISFCWKVDEAVAVRREDGHR